MDLSIDLKPKSEVAILNVNPPAAHASPGFASGIEHFHHSPKPIEPFLGADGMTSLQCGGRLKTRAAFCSIWTIHTTGGSAEILRPPRAALKEIGGRYDEKVCDLIVIQVEVVPFDSADSDLHICRCVDNSRHGRLCQGERRPWPLRGAQIPSS